MARGYMGQGRSFAVQPHVTQWLPTRAQLTQLMGFLPTVLVFLGVLSVLVLAHELGHLVSAKLAGIKVQEFGVGFPPRLFSVRRGETIYSLNALPLGGFVKMLGENAAPGEAQAFASKSRGVRTGVLMAGSLMNLALAPLLFSAALMVGEPVPCDTCPPAHVYGVVPGGPADRAGVHEHDVIAAVAGEEVRSIEDVGRLVRNQPGQPAALQLRRGGELVTVLVTPREMAAEQAGALGIQLGPEYLVVRRTIWEAAPKGVSRVFEILHTLPAELGRMLRGDAGAELTGPVAIARGAGRAAQGGLNYLLAFSAFLSLNLAVVNLLPLPGLDGGRLLFVLIEAVRRGRRVSPRMEGRVHLAGMVLLLGLMAYLSVHDVRGILIG